MRITEWLLGTAVSACVFAASTSLVDASNPVFPGWYADPEAAVFDKRYWIFPTTSVRYAHQTGFDAFSSPDLAHWTRYPDVLSISAIGWAKTALWASAMVRNHGKYYFFFAANDIHNDDEPGGIGVAVADKPDGPYRDLVGTFHNGAQPIDQFVFHDDDGCWYMLYGGWKHANIVRLKDDFTGIQPLDDGTLFKEITPAPDYVEGPMMFKRNGHYYLMWFEDGWGGPDYSVAYTITDAPNGPFKRIGKILQQDSAVATGAGHHSLIHTPDDDAWYIVYHRHPLGDTDPNHWEICIDRMSFDAQAISCH